MKYTAIIVDGGKAGKRIKREAEAMNKSVHLIEVSQKRRRENFYIKTILHEVGATTQRRDHYKDYCIEHTSPFKPKDWADIKNYVKEALKKYMEEDAEEEKDGITDSEDFLFNNNQILSSGKILKADHVFFFNRYMDDSDLKIERLYLFLLAQENLPKRWLFIGGGPKYVEAASILSDLGCTVYMLVKENEVLSGFDENLKESVKDLLVSKGIKILFNISNYEVRSAESSKYSVYTQGDDILVSDVNYFFEEKQLDICNKNDPQPHVCISNIPDNTEEIEKDILERISCAQPNHFSFLPTSIYTNPFVSSIGITEQQAKERNINIRMVNPKFNGLFYSVCEKKEPFNYKIIIEKTDSYEKLIGIHLFGMNSLGIIKGFLIGMQCGISPEDLLKVIPIHPTSSEELIIE
ncbi:glutathione reductase (NADPH) [Nematocida sp. LUAm3]|nr:glutathione reductase (NADPH) [Nematocida sp. LUAm3]KAI5174925.1 glutathione reductase (NADPH) [Nematocida sp. LUAm2]KAI5177476.1 glutathione reductase (NADPH) [Nematocida sp. LUAm1]